MSQYRYKNLLFYSNRDPASLTLLQELTKNPLLDQQFIKICINDPRVKIPERIIQYNKIPVIVCPGFDKPILGEDAFTWIQNNNFSEKSNGMLDYGKMNTGGTDIYSQLIEEFKSSDYNQFHNNEYNLGFGQAKTATSQDFSNLSGLGTQADPTRITTFEDTESKRGSKDLLAQRMEQLQFQRENEFGAPKRIGGLDHNQAHQNNQYRQQAGMSNGGNNNAGNQLGNGGQPGEPMGAQLSAFGNFGSGLDQAYEPFTDKGKSDQQSGGGSTPGLRYNPNPNVSPQMMARNSQMNMPQMNPGMNMPQMNPGMNMPQMNPGMNMPQMPQMNPGMRPGTNMPQMHPGMNMPQMNSGMNMPQMPQMPRGMRPGMNMPQMNPGMNMPQMPQMPQMNPGMGQTPMTNRGMPNQHFNQVGGGNQPTQAQNGGMPPFPGNRPHPNMLLEQAQAQQAQAQPNNPYLQSNRGNANPNTGNQPNPPNNALAVKGMDRPPAGLMNNTPGMTSMTPSYQGLPQPSGGANDSNYYQLS